MQRDQAHRTNELLERIAIALEKNNKKETQTTKDIVYKSEIPGFEGTLDALDVLTDIKTITDDYATPTSDNPDPAGYGNKDEYETDGTSVGNGKYEDDSYTYETDLQGIRVDSDHDIRSTAAYYEEQIGKFKDIKTKKDCILDYVTNEFGLHGARYTDIIKFAYYLGEPNALKYSNRNRGYYACAFNTNGFGGHLIKGGKDFLVKGINKEGNERYFAHSSVDNFTDYFKTIE